MWKEKMSAAVSHLGCMPHEILANILCRVNLHDLVTNVEPVSPHFRRFVRTFVVPKLLKSKLFLVGHCQTKTQKDELRKFLRKLELDCARIEDIGIKNSTFTELISVNEITV